MSIPSSMTAALPPGVPVAVPGRGAVRVHDTGVDTAQPALLLLHGWNIDGVTNWAHALDALAERHRVIVLDHHGHGHGVRPETAFRLEHCATDALQVLDRLGVQRFVAVGYSMGGAVAQLLAHRAPERCVGLVAMASADRWVDSRRERAEFGVLRAAARAARRTPPRMLRPVTDRIMRIACARYPDWVLDVVRQADAVALLEAGAELGRFDSSAWCSRLAQPSAVIVTEQDRVVPPWRQERLAEALPHADTFRISCDHDVPLEADHRFGAVVRTAVDSVLTRVDECSSPASRRHLPEASGPLRSFSPSAS